MEEAEQQLFQVLTEYENLEDENSSKKVIQYCHSRIKIPDSMIEKLKSRGLPLTVNSALKNMHYDVGIGVDVFN